MKTPRFPSFCLIFFVVCYSSIAQDEKQDSDGIKPFSGSPVVKDGAKIRVLADVFEFTEGPAADAEGNVYFTDQPNDRIMIWTADQTLRTFLKPAGRSNGLYFDEAGQLIACADEKNELWRVNVETKEKKVLLDKYNGKLLNGPNDAWADAKGGIYFTDPFYKRAYWNRGDREQDGQHVYYLPAGSEEPVRVASDLFQPNGIVGTPDGKVLYVADIRDSKTYRYEIREDDGLLVNRQLHTTMGSDGMTLDAEGNLYLTGKGVTVVNLAGERIEHIPVPEGWTANVTFGGAGFGTLFVTAMDSLYALEMKVKGSGPAVAKGKK